jgi:hypothetical protein
LFLILHVDLDLVGGLGVADGKTASDFDFGAIFTSGAQQRANNTVLVGVAAEGVVEDGENGL